MRKIHKTILFISLTLSLAALACGLVDFGIVVEPTPTLFAPTPFPPGFNPTRTPYLSDPTRTPYVPVEGETGSLNPIGPWMVFVTGSNGDTDVDNKLWAANPDGSGLTLLAQNFFNKNLGALASLSPAVSPSGGHVAYLAANADGLTPELHIISLPEGSEIFSTPLFNRDALDDYLATLEVMLNKVTSLAWSPDGTRLAFIGAMDGTTADLYMYDIATDSITRLSDGPGQAYAPVWSQDGQWIMHAAASQFYSTEGDSPYFFKIEGIWAARPDGLEVREISGAVEDPQFLRYTPWYGSRFVVHGFGSICDSSTYCWLDAASDETGSFPFQLIEYSINPTTGEVLAVDHTAPTAAGPAPTYYITPDQTEGIQVINSLTDLQWMTQMQAFAAKSDSVPYLQVYLISGGGILSAVDWTGYPPDYMFLAAAPDGQHFAWYRFIDQFETGLWLGDASGQTLVRMFSGEVKDVRWNPDGSGLFFTSDKFNTSPTEYIQGVYYTPADGSNLQLLLEITTLDYVQILGWCGN